MPVFEYIAADKDNNRFSGEYIDVCDVRALRGELSKLGYKLVKARRKKTFNPEGRTHIKQSDVVTFAYKFSGMFSAGLSVVKCLETLEQQAENEAFRYILSDVRRKIETGSSLKDSFKSYSNVFSDFFVGMVEAGETGGKLGKTLEMAAQYLEKQDELKRRVKSAFAYPVIVAVMSIIIVGVLVAFVVPVFSKLYRQLQVPLPLPTLMLVHISVAVREYWWLILTGALLAAIIGRKMYSLGTAKLKLDGFILNIPVFGNLNRMVVVSRFIRTFSMMSLAGVDLLEALEVSSKVANNSEFSKISRNLQQHIATGSSFSEPMRNYEIFPTTIINLAAAGEESGILPEMLAKGADLLDSDIDRTIKSLLMKLEPALTLIMGLMVGFILLGVYLPMFDYMGHLK